MPTARLIGIGFLGSLGLTFIILGCVLSAKWWALLIFLFYAFTPVPLLFVRDNEYENLDGTNKGRDVAMFFVAGMVVSTFAFPIIMAGSPPENPNMSFTDAFLTEMATLTFYTCGGLFLMSTEEDEF